MQKKPRGKRKKKKENDTSDNYFAVQYFLTQWCVGLQISFGEILIILQYVEYFPTQCNGVWA